MLDPRLQRILDRGSVSGSWLLIGAPVHAHTFAEAIAGPADRHLYQPEGRSALHSIASMRELISQVHLPPTDGDYKVFIVEHADRMLTYSANALLKTFEEPPLDTVILLTSRHPQRLLPTIRSRCRRLHFPEEVQSKTLSLSEIEAGRTELEKERVEQLSYPEMGPAEREMVQKRAEGLSTLEFLRNVEQHLERRLREEASKRGLLHLEPVARAAEATYSALQRHSRLAPTLEAFELVSKL